MPVARAHFPGQLSAPAVAAPPGPCWALTVAQGLGLAAVAPRSRGTVAFPLDAVLFSCFTSCGGSLGPADCLTVG